jgi:Na+/H+ antiporter NhaA
MFWLGLILGLFVGAVIGLFLGSMCAIVKMADEQSNINLQEECPTTVGQILRR